MVGVGATVLDPLDATSADQVGCWSVVALMLLGILACLRVPPESLDANGGLLTIPLLGAVTINAANLGTGDYSAAAQVFLIMPVLFAAAKLRSTAAGLVTVVAVLGNAGVTLALAPLARAITDTVFTGVALSTLTVVLVGAQGRAETLRRNLQEQANIDALTGLATRRALDQALSHAVASGVGVALALIDVDDFKSINDLHGHPAGDATLQQLGALLAHMVRRSDAVVGRMGGDELAVLLPHCPAEVAVARAVQLIEAVRASPVTLADGTLIAVSISIGVAHVAGGGDVRTLYSAADQALYQAKRRGRDQVAVAGT